MQELYQKHNGMFLWLTVYIYVIHMVYAHHLCAPCSKLASYNMEYKPKVGITNYIIVPASPVLNSGGMCPPVIYATGVP